MELTLYFRHPEVSDPHLTEEAENDSDSGSSSSGSSSNEDDDNDDDDDHHHHHLDNVTESKSANKPNPKEQSAAAREGDKGSEGRQSDIDDCNGDADDAHNNVTESKSANKPNPKEQSAAAREGDKGGKGSKSKQSGTKRKGRNAAGQTKSRKSSRKKSKTVHFSPTKSKVAPKEVLLSAEKLWRLTLPNLRNLLRDRGEFVTGNKEDLVDRLLNNTINDGRDEDNSTPQVIPSSNIEEILQNLCKQQAELIQLMHEKTKAEQYDASVTAVSTKKAPVNETPGASHIKEVTLNTAAIDPNLQQLRPKRDYPKDDDHDMARFMRHNLEMARLIHENNELRKDRLLNDMVYGAKQYNFSG
jgi:hypothetical protein